MNQGKTLEEFQAENDDFCKKTERALYGLFEAAKKKDELQFAFSLTPEFRGIQDAGWCTAEDTFIAFDEYLEFITKGEDTRLKARITLSFYCHLAEASGFYEIPKNMMCVADGKPYSLWPFNHLVKEHGVKGKVIAPNANKVFRDLVGHAAALGFQELAEVFRDAFNPDLRNGYAHADYIIWDDGIRLGNRNGGFRKLVPWLEFNHLFNRGVNFFHYLREIVNEYVTSYNPAKTIRASLADQSERDWTIHYNPDKGSFRISG